MRSRQILTLSIALCCSLLAAVPVSASTKYTVKRGDNLHDIAKKLNVDLDDLKKANKVEARSLKPGQKLTIPARSKGSESAQKKSLSTDQPSAARKSVDAGASPVKQTSPETKASPSGVREQYVVRKGDTLLTIARAHGLSLSELREMNGLRSSRLTQGQRLMVTKAAAPSEYTVRKGDNIWSIAKKFGLDPDDLMEMNEMETPDLKIGQKLALVLHDEESGAAQSVQNQTVRLDEEINKLAASAEFQDQGTQDRLVSFAKKLMNIPYRFGGNTIFGIDCSAYVKKVYGFLGIDLPRTAREQFNEGEQIEREELSIGDLVFFKTYASFPSHVGIYLGNNLFIHASSRGRKVKIDSLDKPYYLKRYIGGKRLLTQETEPEIAFSRPKS